jgi:hypothetical protein
MRKSKSFGIRVRIIKWSSTRFVAEACVGGAKRAGRCGRAIDQMPRVAVRKALSKLISEM